MENRSTYTIQTLLEELKEGLPALKQGMIFETHKSIFPSADTPKENRNITYKKSSFTKPLACNRKDKENYLKEDSPAADFFKETSRGDFLKVEKIENDIAYCLNLSLQESIKDEFYNDELVPITYNDIASGKVKIYRRNIEKFFNS